ncbi:MAG: hypothetical protein EPO10_11125 [Reyranella sp.]|uniref:hypothetical protein n=1 Tax=Reyranella sp. TaxID=1929291 RepID=UPI001211983C|nr:hypothetical protein [Reyranella sp.]TAJ98054.1 MAG: hypothetical protein EPO41_00920 [Reyranella sp.]TBR28811.1 MAG: hypothetical protein EPO10_11125 [Reyranella sp.]
MALDVYVGSLTRYYAGAWENIVEKAARARGAPHRVRSAKPTDEGKSQDRIRPRVLAWRAALAKALGDRLSAPLDWDETQAAPWYTHRPGWDGFGSLVLWAAYAEHPALRLPETLPEEWDHDLALTRSTTAGFRSRYSHLVRNVEMWLPVAFEITFEGEDVEGRRVVMGSVTTLRRQLADLNAATWKASAADVAAWGRVVTEEGTVEERARFAFAVLTELAERAQAERLPMKLDH